MLTRLETMVNQVHCALLPANLTRLRSLSLNCCARDASRPLTTSSSSFLADSIAAMPSCLTTLRLALWDTLTRADLGMLTQLKVTPWRNFPTTDENDLPKQHRALMRPPLAVTLDWPYLTAPACGQLHVAC
jgi:hypothetical protein